MPEQSAETDPKPPTDPRKPCSICGSTDHTTGYHEGSVSPTGYHEGSLAAQAGGKTDVAEGYHEGSTPAK